MDCREQTAVFYSQGPGVWVIDEDRTSRISLTFPRNCLSGCQKCFRSSPQAYRKDAFGKLVSKKLIYMQELTEALKGARRHPQFHHRRMDVSQPQGICCRVRPL
jgi:hypothetical protein